MKNIILSILLAMPIVASAQGNIKTAIVDFDAGNYPSAIDNLSEILTTNDRDPKANYYLGASYVCMHQNISEGIKRLKFAQVKGIILDSHFYLGRAYELIFEYEQARTSFEKFLKTAKNEKLIAQAHDYLHQIDNSVPLASKIFDIHVIDKYRVTPDSLLSVYNPSREVGQLVHNRDFFESEVDPDGILYRTERGDEVFFSLKNGEGKDKLYKIEKLLDGWGDMTALEGLASSDNDCMPVMMTDGTTLYFSSDRDGGMGGFDIYRTTYDSDSRSFTEPVNLGVPFNSPFDDYLFVGDEFRNRAWFASNRETSPDSLIVYEILWDETVIRNFAQSTDEIRQASLLKIDPSLANMRDDVSSEVGVTKNNFSVTHDTKKFEFLVNDSLTYTQWEHFRSEDAKKKYEQAYNLQQQKDSLTAQMAQKRKEFMMLDSDNERNEKIAEVLQIERSMYTIEDDLKAYQNVARKLENAYIAELIDSGEYVPLNVVDEHRKNSFDWAKFKELLYPEYFELYTEIPFEREHEKSDELYAAIFDEHEILELQQADSLYAWATIVKLEATKVSEHAMKYESLELIDENREKRIYSPQELAERSEYFRKGSAILLNKSYDQKFDIYEDRYEVAKEDATTYDFSEIDELVRSAKYDFTIVEGVALADGVEKYENAAAIKRRGMKSFNDAMLRYSKHLDGTFPLPIKGQQSEPQSVASALSEEQTIAPVPAPVAQIEVEPTPVEEKVVEEQVVEEKPVNKSANTLNNPGDATVSPYGNKPVYRIQLGAFRNKPDATKMAQFDCITSQPIPDRDLTKYFAGQYQHYTDAQAVVEGIRANFSGAFIVAFLNGQQIKLSEAQKME